MAVSSRKVQNKRDSNGVLTGKAGTVYDVNIKYTGQDGKKKSYAKKGFATKKEATQHEAEMKAKLAIAILALEKKKPKIPENHDLIILTYLCFHSGY